ncbi:hypothetical protein ACWCQQ_42580 [Streptomyces sp. NPDC002143]
MGALSVDELVKILGVPHRDPVRDFGTVESSLGIELPREAKEVCSVYGDVMISDFMFVFGLKFMASKNAWMSEFVRDDLSFIPRHVLPAAGGMLHWAHTIEGDKLFLEDRGGGKWTVSAFRRSWGDWYETDDTLVNWLVKVFTGRCATDWMPEWPALHWFEGGQ